MNKAHEFLASDPPMLKSNESSGHSCTKTKTPVVWGVGYGCQRSIQHEPVGPVTINTTEAGNARTEI